MDVLDKKITLVANLMNVVAKKFTLAPNKVFSH